MKKLITLLAFTSNLVLQAQTINGDYLNINNIKAYVNASGDLFYANDGFEVPIGSGKRTNYVSTLWIGGFDPGASLRIAGQTYRQTGTDFWPGPLTSTATTDSATMAYYNRVWKVNKCDIDNYYYWVASGMIGTNPADSSTMEAINSWPAFTLDGQPLAPFWDINTNGIYEPFLGEVPEIKGDQAILFVFNDKGGIHGETGGQALGIEMLGMMYAYNCTDDSSLNNTIFTNYKIRYKAGPQLDSVFIGNWTDFDIGSANDDFVECDVARGAYFGFNADSLDDNPPAGQVPYGLHPPAQAVVFQGGPYANPNGLDDTDSSTPNGFNYGDGIIDNERLGMSRFVYYNNDATVTGNPSSSQDYYNYISGAWKDGTLWTYGGNGHLSSATSSHYFFPSSSDPAGFGTSLIPQAPWDEYIAGNVCADRRGLGSYGPFTMSSGQVTEVDFAYVYARSATGDHLASVDLMKEYIDSVKAQFGAPGCGCDGLTGITAPAQEESISIYPNPASTELNVQIPAGSEGCSLQIYDGRGRLVQKNEDCTGLQKIGIHAYESGLYLVRLIGPKSSHSGRFIKH